MASAETMFSSEFDENGLMNVDFSYFNWPLYNTLMMIPGDCNETYGD